MAAQLPIAAAQYLRMSTEHQQYSTENQSRAISEYANTHSFLITRTYSDPAKNGLWLKNRPGLRELLKDVTSGQTPYRAILVYDVSRWGRFQDTDKSAHYEFLCKSAGIPVHYCAETFPNDGSLPSLMMKALKRVMAGEYSRELRDKVLAGQASGEARIQARREPRIRVSANARLRRWYSEEAIGVWRAKESRKRPRDPRSRPRLGSRMDQKDLSHVYG